MSISILPVLIKVFEEAYVKPTLPSACLNIFNYQMASE